MVLGHGDEGAQIFRQAGATEAEARVHEIAADPVIQADAPRNRRDIDAKRLAQIGHNIDERDLGGEEGVRRLLDEFRRRHAREHDRAVEVRLVEVEQERPRAGTVRADDDAVGLKKVADRRALAEEFRIARDLELVLWPGQASNGPVDPPGGAGGNGALLDDELVAVKQRRDRAGDLLDLSKVGTPVVSWRRAHADEDDVGGADRLLGPCREMEPAGVEVRGQQFRQTRLAYGRHAL